MTACDVAVLFCTAGNEVSRRTKKDIDAYLRAGEKLPGDNRARCDVSAKRTLFVLWPYPARGVPGIGAACRDNPDFGGRIIQYKRIDMFAICILLILDGLYCLIAPKMKKMRKINLQIV